MTLVVLSAVAAALLGFVCRGSLARLFQPPTRRNGLLAFGVVSLTTVYFAQHPGVWAGWLGAGALALLAYARLNRGRPGLALMAAGMLLNLVVIAANSGMPVSLDAAERAGMSQSRLDLSADPLREPIEDSTTLTWIGATVPLALPVLPDVASPGDLLVAAGAAVFLFTGLTGRGRPRPEPPKRQGKRARKRERAAEQAAQAATAAVPTGATVFDVPRTAAGADAASAGGVLVGGPGAPASSAAVAAAGAEVVVDTTEKGPRDPFTQARLPRSAPAPPPTPQPAPAATNPAPVASTAGPDVITAPVVARPRTSAPLASAVATPSGDAGGSPSTAEPPARRPRPGRSAKRNAAAARRAAATNARRVAGRSGSHAGGTLAGGSHAADLAGESAGAASDPSRQGRQRDQRDQRRQRRSPRDRVPAAEVSRAENVTALDTASEPGSASPRTDTSATTRAERAASGPPAAWNV